MKVTKTEWVETEVTVEVSYEDIAESIAEDSTYPATMRRGVSNCHQFLKAITDEMIAEQTPEARKTIYDALLLQVIRWAPSNV